MGRDEPLALLGAAWAAVRGGGLAAAVIVGEPGIGKSRLAAEFAAQEAAAGAVVLAGRAEPAPLQPYQLLVDALRATTLADHTEAEPSDPHAGLVRRHEQLAGALEDVARGRPMVLVLDDLHWADAGSLDFLRHLAVRGAAMSLLVVATLRPGTLAVLAPLERELELTRIELGGLRLHEAAALVAGRGAEMVADADLERLASRTGGNPFFIEVLLDAGLAAGDALPAGVAELVAGRLASLGGAARRLLAAGAVLGSSFDLERAAVVAELAIEEALAALDAAEASRLVSSSVGAGGRVRFVHALVHEALVGATPAGQRTALHARALAALEGFAADSDEALVAAARHAIAAVPVVSAGRAAELAERAGAALLTGYAPADAAELLAAAAAMLDERGEPAALRASIRCVLGEALRADGRGREANVALEQAELLARRAGDGVVLARWALALAGPPVTIFGADPDRLAALEGALEQLPHDQSELRSRLQARLAIELAYETDSGRRERLSAAAVAAARETGEPWAIAAALGARHVVLWGPDHTRERLALADEMLGFARRAGDAALELQARTWRIVDLEELGDGAALEAELDAYAAAAARSRLTAYGWYVPGWRAARAYLAGRIDEGHRLRRRAAEHGRRAGDGNVQFAVRSNWIVDLADGRAIDDAAFEWLAERIRVSPASWAYRSMHVWMLAARGNEDDARRELAAHRRDGAPAAWPRDTNWLSAITELSEAAVILSEHELGAELAALLEPFDDRIVVSARGFMCFGSVAGVLGRLAELSSEPALACRRYEQAIELEEGAGALIWAAAHRFRLGVALVASGDERGRAELLRVQDEAPRLGLDALAVAATAAGGALARAPRP